MISCNLKGRLGNMMFQISAIYSLAIDNNTFCKFVHQENPSNGSSSSKYINTLFKNVDFSLVDYKELSNLYTEPGFEYNKLKYKKNTLYDGYFQSEKYFSHNRDKIVDLFDLRNIEKINDVIAVHIRRGDYIKYDDVHKNLWNTNYYSEAFKYYGKEKNYKIFSDDIKWCKKNIKLDNVTFSENTSDYDDFIEIKKHRNKIIANSSFSWWCAWAPGEDQCVIAPSVWFGEKGPKKWDSIYCKGWKII